MRLLPLARARSNGLSRFSLTKLAAEAHANALLREVRSCVTVTPTTFRSQYASMEEDHEALDHLRGPNDGELSARTLTRRMGGIGSGAGPSGDATCVMAALGRHVSLSMRELETPLARRPLTFNFAKEKSAARARPPDRHGISSTFDARHLGEQTHKDSSVRFQLTNPAADAQPQRAGMHPAGQSPAEAEQRREDYHQQPIR